ncbi:MAG: hypothetical protein ABI409_07935 [Ramlibacter sp.]
MALKIVLAGLGATLAACLLWFGATTHLERACVVLDTPYLPLCPQALPDSDPGRQQDLRARLRNNPGDSGAWVALASLEPVESHEALLHAVAALAPSDPNSLRLRARQALTENKVELATDLLVKMTEHQLGGEEPPQLLARLLAGSEGMALLRPHLTAGSHWVSRVLGNLVALKLPLQAGLPLLAEAAAKGLVPPATTQAFVRSLKAGGQWADAYGLWVGQQRQPVPLLFNGGFAQRFQADGFDWEVTPVSPGRAGALVSQRNLSGHGPVLEVQYTGRAVAIPVIRQYLFIAPGRYVLKGQYMSAKLRMEQGLTWAVRCTGPTSALAGRSAPLKDSAAVWQTFQFEFNVTAACGMAASLQLETFAPFEAAAGFTGKASFDSFELRPVDP